MYKFYLDKKIEQAFLLKNHNPKRFVFSMALVVVLFFINFILYCLSPFSTFFLKRNLIIGIFTGIFVFCANFSITYLIAKFLKKRNRPTKLANNLSILYIDNISFYTAQTFLIIILLASIEEFVFRSYLLSFLNRLFIPIISIVVNAILFYFIHFNKKVFELMFMAIVFSMVTIYSNDILPAIIAHSLNNIFVYIYRKKRHARNFR
jgi:membrane protease YdiL (CAAX protease family)